MNVRETNFELLRNMAMFMVLVIHANFVCLPRPLASDLATSPAATCFRYLVESLGIVGVVDFVLISGWFRVKTDTRRVLKFVFQVLFFWCGGYLFCILMGKAELSWNGLLYCFSFTEWEWFTKAYAVLFIIAPVMNAFVDQASERQLRNVIIAFFLFQSTFGWIGGARRFFVSGYGPLSFIGLYLLAQYVRNTQGKGRHTPFDFPRHVDLLIFFSCAILNTVFALVFINQEPFSFAYAYCNPLVILGALYLLLFFSKLKMKTSRVINWIGASSFAVYLVHSQFDIRKIFTRKIVKLYSDYDGVCAVGLIFLFLVLTFVISIFLDQFRIWAWNRIGNQQNKKDVQASH